MPNFRTKYTLFSRYVILGHMENDQIHIMSTSHVVIWIIVALIIGGGIWFGFLREENPFPIDSRDTITSWELTNIYADNPEGAQRVKENIQRFKEEIGKKENTEYELYVSIANEYRLLGDGKQSYNYLQKALAVDNDRTSVAWHNIGIVLRDLGAIHSARTALRSAYEIQPLPTYKMAYECFLAEYFPDEQLLSPAEGDVSDTQTTTDN